MSCFFQRNLYPPINTDTVVDIYNFWIRQLCSSKHATQTLPELIAPQKSTPGFGWAKQNPRRFSHGRNMHRKIHPMVGRLSCGPMGHGLRPRSFRRIDWDNFGFRGWAVEIGSLFFFGAHKISRWRSLEKFVFRKVWTWPADGWCCFGDVHLKEVWVISGRFSRKGSLSGISKFEIQTCL